MIFLCQTSLTKDPLLRKSPQKNVNLTFGGKLRSTTLPLNIITFYKLIFNEYGYYISGQRGMD